MLLLTDGHAVRNGRTLAATVAAALEGGVDGVVVRERQLAPGPRRALGQQVRAAAQAAGSPAALLWAAPLPNQPRPAGGSPGPGPDAMTADLLDGVHLRARDPFPHWERPVLVGRSCHDEDDLRRAANEGCDYVTLSPVAATGSKPGYGPALGVDGVRALLERAAYLNPGAPRVLALGGVEAGAAHQWLEAGAHGVAVMGAVMRANDPANIAARLVAEVTG
ncbi:thiamine phosphate synthase [Pedococcus sp. P5_B7]